MKTLLTILFLSLSPLGAQDFAGVDLKASLKAAAENEVEILEKRPLLALLAERDKASVKLKLGEEFFYVTYSFDADWEPWFSIKPETGFGAGAWKEEALKKGVFYYHGKTRLFIREIDGTIGITFSLDEPPVEIKKDELFSALYSNSGKITFGELVTYAVFRNLAPMTEQEGTVTMRIGSDGLFYYSLTPDTAIPGKPRWLLAVNGVLYGMRLDEAELVFVSKKINIDKPSFLLPEKIHAPAGL